MTHPNRCICVACENERKDAARFRFLQNTSVVEAQAFFWTFQSRKQRAKAIDEAMRATESSLVRSPENAPLK